MAGKPGMAIGVVASLNDGREVAPTIGIGIVKDDDSAVIQTTYALTYKVADIFQMDGDVAGNDDIGLRDRIGKVLIEIVLIEFHPQLL